MENKKKWARVAGAAIVIAIGGGLILNQTKYVNQHNLSSKMDKEITAYLGQKESEYLVYFYDKDFCETCGSYTAELKDYEKKEGALPVYKATGKEETALAFENDLFVDKRYPVVVHVKDGEEYFRYVGPYPIDSLPFANAKDEQQASPLETPVSEEVKPTEAKDAKTSKQNAPTELDAKADESSEQ